MRAFLDRHDDELGTVRLCQGCREDWPKDAEFWYFNAQGKVLGHCRACWSERRRIARPSDSRFRLVGKRAYT